MNQATTAAKVVVKNVRPILSLNRGDARRRVLALYKAWYRDIPFIVLEFQLPKNQAQCREKLREKFLEHKDITDIRVIDMLVIKGQMELQETHAIWKQQCHVMAFWRDTVEKKPTDFLSKFLDGHD